MITINSGTQRFLLLHLGPVLPAVVFLFALEATTIDSTVSNWFFDPVAGAFPLRYNGVLEIVGHQWTKQLVIVMACCVIGVYLMSFILRELKPRRRLLLFLSLALSLAPLAVVALKAISFRHCPWSLQEYGGFAPHLSLFDAAPPGMLLGHCFPSGHASTGFCLLAFYFAGLALGNRRLALAGLWGGFAGGMLLGMARVAQGAHFLSHNLWSALVCWVVILALYIAIMGTPKQSLSPAMATGAG